MDMTMVYGTTDIVLLTIITHTMLDTILIGTSIEDGTVESI